VCAIAVDEVHLLNTWGKGWRKAFQQIGWVRARFSNVVLIALTETMRGAHRVCVQVSWSPSRLISFHSEVECAFGYPNSISNNEIRDGREEVS